MDELQRKDEIVQAMMNVEYYPTFEEADAEENQYTKVPWAELSALGVGFASLPASMRTITETVTTVLGPNVFQRVDGLDMGLVQAKNMPGLFRGVAQNGTHLDGGTLFKPMATAEAVRDVTVPFDPTAMLMAATLMSINQKMDEILDTQKEILDYLQQQERAKMKGDLNTLSDVMGNYKYNWANTMQITNQHSQVLDIKRDAEQGIVLHRDQIGKKIGKKSFLHSDQEVQKKLHGIKAELKDYQMALYVFGFSSFLEVMLSRNFNKEYLDGVAAKIEAYSFQYRELYTDCYNQLESESGNSIQTALLGGVAHITRGAGDVIAKIPLVSRGQLDEALIGAGERMGKTKDRKAFKTMQTLTSGQTGIVKPFIDNIRIVNKLYNEPMAFFFDRDNLYLKLPDAV